MKKILYFLITIIVVVCVISTASCFFWVSNTPRIKIRVVENPWSIQQGLIRIAERRGYFKKQGLTIEYVNVGQVGRDSLIALEQNKLDIAAAALVPIAIRIANGSKISIVSNIHYTDGLQYIGFLKSSGIKKPSDLKGKTVSAPIQTSSHFALYLILKYNGVNPQKDVKWIYLPPREAGKALATHKIDAVSTFLPHLFNMQRDIGEDFTSIPIEGFYFESHNLVVRTDWAKQHKGDLIKFHKALLEARDYLYKNPEDGINIILSEPELQEYAAEYKKQINTSQFYVEISTSYIGKIESILNWAYEQGFITNKNYLKINYYDHLYFDVLESIDPDLVFE